MTLARECISIMHDASSMDRLDALRRALCSGARIHDRDFDAIYPAAVRSVSRTFWTPVHVAQRAAELLGHHERARILDIGSGAGKLCIVGALSTRAHFTGLEQRPHLVEVARDAAERLGVSSRAHFIHGDLRDIEWGKFDAFYLFNPFSENLYGPQDHLDTTVELSRERFLRDVDIVYEALECAPPATRVVTYHGLGRDLPPSYRNDLREGIGSDVLELWVQSEAVARVAWLP